MGLAVPLVVAKSTTLTAKHGLLIKIGQHLKMQEKLQLWFLIKPELLHPVNFEVSQIFHQWLIFPRMLY